MRHFITATALLALVTPALAQTQTFGNIEWSEDFADGPSHDTFEFGSQDYVLGRFRYYGGGEYANTAYYQHPSLGITMLGRPSADPNFPFDTDDGFPLAFDLASASPAASAIFDLPNGALSLTAGQNIHNNEDPMMSVFSVGEPFFIALRDSEGRHAFTQWEYEHYELPGFGTQTRAALIGWGAQIEPTGETFPTFDVRTFVPSPGALALLGIGAMGLRRRR